MLKNVIDTLSKNYDVTLLDSPAGLEHFARKTGRDVSDLVIVTDPSKMGIHTMKRIIELVDELVLRFENIWILGNRFPKDLIDILEEEVKTFKNNKVHFLGTLPNDEDISKINMLGKNLLEMPPDNATFEKAKEMFAKIV